MAFQDLRGTDGNVVIRMGRNGLTLTPHVTPRNPRTAAQVDVRNNLTKAAKTFENLTTSQADAWREYAKSLTVKDPITGKTYEPTAISVFVGLSSKFLQLSPTGTIPVTPPTTDFLGDTIKLEAQSETPGTIQFQATGANAAGVTTEVLLQRLPNRNRTPNAKAYEHAGFKAFTAGSLTLDVDVTAGYYAAAYRFVKTSTGQMTEFVPLPVFPVSFSIESGNAKPTKKKAA